MRKSSLLLLCSVGTSALMALAPKSTTVAAPPAAIPSTRESGTSAERKSTDGETFPSPIDAYMQKGLPGLFGKIGCLPEQFAKGVFRNDPDGKLAKTNHLPKLDGDWLVLANMPPSTHAVTFALTDGRVTRIWAFWSAPDPQAAQDLRDRYSKLPHAESLNDGRIQMTARAINGRKVRVYFSGNQYGFSIQADLLDIYLASHVVQDEVATAMLNRSIIEGMTMEEATLSLGAPEDQSVNGQLTQATWRIYLYSYPGGGGTYHSMSDYARHLQDSIGQSPNKTLLREITVTFKGGIAKKVQDQSFK